MPQNGSSPIPTDFVELLRRSLDQLGEGFRALPPWLEPSPDTGRVAEVLNDVAIRLRDNFPYFHPLYAGQMLKPPHVVAQLAYALALWINPNNHALDGGRASSRMEKEAVAEIATMLGFRSHLGHLTSGGTMANLEALWISGQLHPGRTIVASSQAHYTHARLSKVLGLPFETTPCDSHGRLDLAALERRLSHGGVGTVVATIGTTAAGAVDPLAGLVDLRRRFPFRLHADAAYGGYFRLVEGLPPETQRAYESLSEVDSLVIDPHKHGLQPYGCGCVLFADPAVGQFYKHDSPYTYFSSTELHLGDISLACSRPGAAAVALWATQRMLPLVHGGEFARGLAKSREAARALFHRLAGDTRFVTAFPPELDILLWIPRANRVSEASKLAERLFREAAVRHLDLALATVPVAFFNLQVAGMEIDCSTVRCLRSVLMKPEHLDWIDRILSVLDQACGAAGLKPLTR